MPRSPRATNQNDAVDDAGEAEIPSKLSFRQAQAALELCLARLQEADLDVETMAGLYRRALAYSERCEAVLHQVEQEVMQWDPEQPDESPSAYTP